VRYCLSFRSTIRPLRGLHKLFQKFSHLLSAHSFDSIYLGGALPHKVIVAVSPLFINPFRCCCFPLSLCCTPNRRACLLPPKGKLFFSSTTFDILLQLFSVSRPFPCLGFPVSPAPRSPPPFLAKALFFPTAV